MLKGWQAWVASTPFAAKQVAEHLLLDLASVTVTANNIISCGFCGYKTKNYVVKNVMKEA